MRRAELFYAADAYAQAQRANEGSCAGEGLKRVTQRQAESLAATASGHAAESSQDLRGAESAYDEALKLIMATRRLRPGYGVSHEGLQPSIRSGSRPNAYSTRATTRRRGPRSSRCCASTPTARYPNRSPSSAP